MDSKISLGWLGGALLATAVLGTTFFGGNDDAAPAKPAAQPEFFPFLKPIESMAPQAESMPLPTEAENQNASRPVQEAKSPATMITPDKLAAVEAHAHKMRADGESDDAIYRMRAQHLSAEAAARIADREQREKAWQPRLALYLAEQNRLLASNASPEALEQLRNTHFSADEQELLAASEPAGIPTLVLR